MSEELKWYTPQEMLAWKPPTFKNIISQNILTVQGLMMIYGHEGVGKSLIAMDLAYKIAQGLPWLGFDTIPTTICYFQSEIPQIMMKDRMDQYTTTNKINPQNLRVATDLYNKVDKGWGATQLEKGFSAIRPGLGIIDPVNNSITASMVDDYQMGLFMDRINMWRKDYKMGFILINHERKSEHKEGQSFHYGTNESFGARLSKAADTVIYIESVMDGDPLIELVIHFEKTRYGKSRIQPVEAILDRRNIMLYRKESNRVLYSINMCQATGIQPNT